MKIGLIVSKKWNNLSRSNKLFIDFLKNKNIEAYEYIWEELDQAKECDVMLITCAWGYDVEYKKYLFKLEQLSKSTQLLNGIEIIKTNISKELQFREMMIYELPLVETIIINNSFPIDGFINIKYQSKLDFDYLAKVFSSDMIVIKPNISSSGKETYLFDMSDVDSRELFQQRINQIIVQDKCVLVQPFLPEIQQGEYALIYINGHLTHSVIRKPGIFEKREKAQLLTDIPDDLLNLGNKVVKSIWKKGMIYMRVDIVATNLGLKIMEIECNEPELYFYLLPDDERKCTFQLLLESINNHLSVYLKQ